MHRLPIIREAAGGTRTAYRCGPSEREGTAAGDEAVSDARDPDPRVLYRCCGCGLEFAPALPGAAPCPRCGSIGGHEAIGHAGGVPDGG